MSLYDSLLNTLKQQVSGNLSRLKCLTDLVFAIAKSRSVNLVKAATDSQINSLQSSRSRRFQRFFAELGCVKGSYISTDFEQNT